MGGSNSFLRFLFSSVKNTRKREPGHRRDRFPRRRGCGFLLRAEEKEERKRKDVQRPMRLRAGGQSSLWLRSSENHILQIPVDYSVNQMIAPLCPSQHWTQEVQPGLPSPSLYFYVDRPQRRQRCARARRLHFLHLCTCYFLVLHGESSEDSDLTIL